MSINELVSKISQENASAALVITSFKGNPGTLQFLSTDGTTPYEMRLESAALRREVANDVRNRIDDLSRVVSRQYLLRPLYLGVVSATYRYRALSFSVCPVCESGRLVIGIFMTIGFEIWTRS